MVLSYAQAAVEGLKTIMEIDPSVVVLGEDVGRGGIFGQYKGLQEAFGAARVIDTPISESTIMGAGVGMALAGMRPVVELRVVDFALCAMDEIVNQAAKARFMFGGQGRTAKGLPIVMRMPGGIWDASAAQHSQSLEAWFAHLPGVCVVCPSTAQDNYSLMQAALASGDPVIYIEHKTLWGTTGEVDTRLPVKLGKAAIRQVGHDITLVSWSKQALIAQEAAQTLAGQGVSVEMIDLRSIWPWDRDAVLNSCAKTKKLLVVHEAIQAGGFGAEIAATVAEHVGCRVKRLGAPRIPVGYAPILEQQSRVSAPMIVDAVKSFQ
jgi:acetoin:2,6-dichlorophenolindophenol oxidoreductase subunit beta